MKGIDIFCASQASTAICLSMDQIIPSSSSSSNTIQLGGRAIDRHNPIIRDSRRITTPCSSQPPINPKPYNHQQKTKKSSSSSKPRDHKIKKSSTKVPIDDQKKKSTTSAAAKPTEHVINNYSTKPIDSILRKSWVKPPSNLVTPPGSSRYLLSDTAILDGLSEYDPVFALVDPANDKKALHQDEASSSTSSASKESNPSCSSQPKTDQIVVLRVSLHCKGCAGKVKKHLSRMQGVTSFDIDFAAKKVTVVGDVTPLSVLASVSKVKNAQFWPVSTTAASVDSAAGKTGKKEIKSS
ncbi:Protein SODIUM POTASSIUM ROOT DEFECTIVE 2 [Quillaja saponaria]|uniref:Protein SODIUM POTASSIUM ROOT DEFECTIVE 2 n=1 Tax=Quillaja saponaria TaxID=32244 RepID=A0AAD7Q8Y6_QUISA|nr:Protein SODIUM POTASSIUM ROOT DEFECTIVE 2 [Quillaja saponaria]